MGYANLKIPSLHVCTVLESLMEAIRCSVGPCKKTCVHPQCVREGEAKVERRGAKL